MNASLEDNYRLEVGCEVNLFAWLEQLLEVVAQLLHVSKRPIELRVCDEPSFVAYTQMALFPKVPRVKISRDLLRAGVIAHELTHCLIPTPWLFLAEGLATWIGCQVAGNCEDLFFAELTLEDVLARSWEGYPQLIELLDEKAGCGKYLSPERFYRLDSRLAHALAGSFCGFWLMNYPNLPQEIAVREAPSPRTLIGRTWDGGWSEIECAWQTWRQASKAD